MYFIITIYFCENGQKHLAGQNIFSWMRIYRIRLKLYFAWGSRNDYPVLLNSFGCMILNSRSAIWRFLWDLAEQLLKKKKWEVKRLNFLKQKYKISNRCGLKLKIQIFQNRHNTSYSIQIFQFQYFCLVCANDYATSIWNRKN